MGIFNEICITIDVVNNEINNYDGNFKNIYCIKKEYELKKSIDKYLKFPYLKIETVLEFLSIYHATLEYIDIENINVNIDDMTNIIYCIINIDNNSFLKIIHRHQIENKMELSFIRYNENKQKAYATYNIIDDFRYTGIDDQRRELMENVSNIIKAYMRKYLYARMKVRKEIEINNEVKTRISVNKILKRISRFTKK